MINYKIYPSLLDCFQDYVGSDLIWEKYWGGSENPPHTPEQFRQIQFETLINRINRVPMRWEDSEAADKGTAFNEIVDCLIEHRDSKKMELHHIGDNPVTAIKAIYKDREFTFPIEPCRTFASYFKGAITQQYVESVIYTIYGDVLIYGFIDELMPQSVCDIKMTNRYNFGKFRNHAQHLVYPYCLQHSGNDIFTFEYVIYSNNEMSKECYSYVPERDNEILRKKIESFIEFLLTNKKLITDTKIFNQ